MRSFQRVLTMIQKDTASSFNKIGTPHYNCLFFFVISTIFYWLVPVGRTGLDGQAIKWIWQRNMIVLSQKYCITGLIKFCVFIGLTTRLLILSQPSECQYWARLSEGRDLKVWSLIVSKPCSSITCLWVASTGIINYRSAALGFLWRDTFRSGTKRLTWAFWISCVEFVYCLEYVDMDVFFIAL